MKLAGSIAPSRSASLQIIELPAKASMATDVYATARAVDVAGEFFNKRPKRLPRFWAAAANGALLRRFAQLQYKTVSVAANSLGKNALGMVIRTISEQVAFSFNHKTGGGR